jgi:YbbR domain-containing protein
MSQNEKHVAGDDGSYEIKKNRKLNILAFVACIFASFLIWIYVMNTQNTDYTKTFTLSVDVLNAEQLEEDRNLAVYGVPSKDVTVTIRGKKSDVRKYIEKDFRAYLDLSSVKQKGLITLGTVVETPSAALTVVSIEPSGVDVDVDTPMSKVLVPTSKCLGENGDKIILELAADTPTIEITGPSTYIEKIKRAEVVVPYSDTYKVGDSVTTSGIRLYGEDDSLLSTLYLTVVNDSFIVKVVSINE